MMGRNKWLQSNKKSVQPKSSLYKVTIYKGYLCTTVAGDKRTRMGIMGD
ncbi:hypothetical protein ACJIZ3_021119 [Penstemon smallii]|uniref:Uncharacterized protein n=1 Tax=Penstemon smallii TaxID=265156 RepID=A0ABD3SKW2_9LAMI